MTDKTAGLAKARAERSLKKRRAVEKAINELKGNDDIITFKAVALLAGVSRQYLYNNFKADIQSQREDSRNDSTIIDGVKVPARTPDEFKHTEALLRNKIKELKKDLGTVRQENARLKNELERERGNSEHFRQNWIKARSN